MKMDKLARMMLATVAAGVLGSAARADVVFDIANRQFLTQSGTAAGTLTGNFTTTNDLSKIVSYNLVASSVAGSFAGYTYLPTNSAVTASTLPQQYFRIDDPSLTTQLQLYFTTSLTTTGATLSSTGSYESEASGGNRLLSGSVVGRQSVGAVPEPAAWSLMIAGFGLVGTAMRRRWRTAVSFG